MKITECKRCSLVKSRLHLSMNKGKYPANVLIIFGKEPKTQRVINQQEMFVKKLNELLSWDWYYTYAIRCHCNKSAKFEHIKSCRFWLNKVYKKVQPYLVIIMGRVAVRAYLGEKYKNLPQGIFYYKKDKAGDKQQVFIGPKISEDSSTIQENLTKLLIYIKECYG